VKGAGDKYSLKNGQQVGGNAMRRVKGGTVRHGRAMINREKD
jgi:lipoate-protein ligase A